MVLTFENIFQLTPLICGDGITQKELEEECDDGNVLDGDGCSSDCIVCCIAIVLKSLKSR